MVFKRHANLYKMLLADASKKVNDGIKEIIKLPKNVHLPQDSFDERQMYVRQTVPY